MITDNKKIDIAVNLIYDEFKIAQDKFGPFNSTHEGYAVMKEELDELWEAIKQKDTNKALSEAAQVGAMALRFIFDIREQQNEQR